MKRILVTGGAGFIGSHLCERLLADLSNEVWCIDNLYTGSRDNIEHLFLEKRFNFFEHDITDSTPFERDVFPTFSEIYNLACPASPVHYQNDPVGTVRTNVLGAITLLEYAKKTGSKILQASTSEVYGDPLEHPQKESYWGNVNPIGPRACYDEGKRCAETLFMDYWRQHKVRVGIARIFNTYGPRMAIDDGRVVSNFLVQALNGENITIYGSGNQTRSFCYVDDLVAGLIKLMKNHCEGGHDPFNLGNPDECFSINELAQIVKEITWSKGLIFTQKSLPEDDPKRRQPDIWAAKNLLNWEPKWTLKSGLVETRDYFTAKLNEIKKGKE